MHRKRRIPRTRGGTSTPPTSGSIDGRTTTCTMKRGHALTLLRKNKTCKNSGGHHALKECHAALALRSLCCRSIGSTSQGWPASLGGARNHSATSKSPTGRAPAKNRGRPPHFARAQPSHRHLVLEVGPPVLANRVSRVSSPGCHAARRDVPA